MSIENSGGTMMQTRDVQTGHLLSLVAALKKEGYRLVTVTCVASDHKRTELLYHFDRRLALLHLRLACDAVLSVPSITPVYAAAYLAENEIQDLFGLSFTGLAPDYRRTLYLQDATAEPPFARSLGREEADSC